MKKAYVYLISFFALIVLFSGCYYFSYQAALKQFNTNATEKSPQILAEINQGKREEESVTVDTVKEDIVSPETKYTLEVYNLQDNTFKENKLTTPEFLVGLNRNKIIEYLAHYMQDVPLEEYEKGLISFELISMSNTDVILRKTYNIDNVPYQYYLAILDGYLTVFYSDKKTVYEYTQIEAANLPEEERNKLIDGIDVKNQEELYGILENYSS